MSSTRGRRTRVRPRRKALQEREKGSGANKQKQGARRHYGKTCNIGESHFLWHPYRTRPWRQMTKMLRINNIRKRTPGLKQQFQRRNVALLLRFLGACFLGEDSTRSGEGTATLATPARSGKEISREWLLTMSPMEWFHGLWRVGDGLGKNFECTKLKLSIYCIAIKFTISLKKVDFPDLQIVIFYFAAFRKAWGGVSCAVNMA